MNKSKRENIFYLGVVLLAVISIAIAALFSDNYASESEVLTSATSTGGVLEQIGHHFGTFLHFVKAHVFSQFGLLLLQIIIILIFARLVAWLFTKIGQPSVIGEIIAGIILGPSVFGLLFPEAFGTIFPVHSLGNISLLSQFGLILFMFVIGMELDLSEIQKNLKKSLIISHASTVLPFVLGLILAFFLFSEYGGSGSTPLTFALFVGISLSVTAFPVLARIIQEQNKMNTQIGILSMASAASGDITAWSAVAMIMALAQSGSPGSAIFTVIAAVLYIFVMFRVVRPAFRVIGEAYNTSEVAGTGVVALIFVTLLLSSYITEILGLHALFGAFIAGVVMPDNLKFRAMMTEKVEDVSLSLFLPLFFVSSGLQTEIGLLNTTTHWLITLVIILIAIVGKVGGTYVACRVVGENHRDSTFIGILMNTRGLMELIILSMGLQLNILSPVMYAMLVVMTLVTTFITTPLLDFATAIWKRQDARKPIDEPRQGLFHILFSFGRTSTGQVMLNLIHTFFPKQSAKLRITGMHVTMDSEVGWHQAEEYRRTKFDPIQEQSELLGYNLQELYEVSDHPVPSILKATNDANATLLLVGASLDLSILPEDQKVTLLHDKYRSRYGKALSHTAELFNIAQLFRDKTTAFVEGANNSVGVVIDRGLSSAAKSILILEDTQLQGHSSFAHLMSNLTHSMVPGTTVDKMLLNGEISLITAGNILQEEVLTEGIARQYDLLVLPYATWQTLSATLPEFIIYIPTTLLVESRYTGIE